MRKEFASCERSASRQSCAVTTKKVLEDLREDIEVMLASLHDAEENDEGTSAVPFDDIEIQTKAARAPVRFSFVRRARIVSARYGKGAAENLGKRPKLNVSIDGTVMYEWLKMKPNAKPSPEEMHFKVQQGSGEDKAKLRLVLVTKKATGTISPRHAARGDTYLWNLGWLVGYPSDAPADGESAEHRVVDDSTLELTFPSWIFELRSKPSGDPIGTASRDTKS